MLTPTLPLNRLPLRARATLFSVFAAVSLAVPISSHAANYDFALITDQGETDGSWYRANDGAIKEYGFGTVLSLDLPESGGEIQSGSAQITNFVLPGPFESIGMYFGFTDVPSLVSGDITVSGGEATLLFESIPIGFERGDDPDNAFPGTLLLTLTTDPGTEIPVDCEGRTEPTPLPGVPLDLNTGELRLVGVVCPYETSLTEYEEAFRVQIAGSVLPESGPAGAWGGGLLLAGLARRKPRSARI